MNNKQYKTWKVKYTGYWFHSPENKIKHSTKIRATSRKEAKRYLRNMLDMRFNIVKATASTIK